MTQMTDSNPEEGEEVESSVIERDSNRSKSSDSNESSLVATHLSHLSLSSLRDCQEEYFRFRNDQSFEFAKRERSTFILSLLWNGMWNDIVSIGCVTIHIFQMLSLIYRSFKTLI